MTQLTEEKSESLVESKRRQNVLITGANRGIGLSTACLLARRGAYNVTIACRNETRAREAVHTIQLENPKISVDYLLVDLASLNSVRVMNHRIADENRHYDVVILNAGVLMPSEHFTVDGIETTFQVNYLSHYLIVRSLIESRKRNSAEENRKSPLKVVTLTSVLYRLCGSVFRLPRARGLFTATQRSNSSSAFFHVDAPAPPSEEKENNEGSGEDSGPINKNRRNHKLIAAHSANSSTGSLFSDAGSGYDSGKEVEVLDMASMKWMALFNAKPKQQWRAYALSKLATAMLAANLNRMFSADADAAESAGVAVVAVAVHPGAVHTDISANIGAGTRKRLSLLKRVLISADASAEHVVYCVENELQPQHYRNCGASCRLSSSARDERNLRALHQLSEALCRPFS